MKISKTAAATARRIFGLCQVNGSLDEDRLRKAVVMLKDGQVRELHAVLGALHRLTRLELEGRKVIVESAVELDEASRSKVLAELSAKYGADLDIEYKINAELIGGMRIKVGDDVFDGSVQGRLNRLEAAF